MKKLIVILLAVAMLAVSVPVFAGEHQHDVSQKATAEECTRECELLLKNCGLEVESIQQRIKRLNVEINEKGANKYTLEELKTLHKKLKEATEIIRVLEKPR